MDQKRSLTDTLSRWTTEPRARGFIVALFALGLLVILQVKQHPTMCELFAGQQLQSEDLQRMQLVFTQQGLNSFQIENNSILVPVGQQAEYVQVAIDHRALPASSNELEPEEISVSPFMSMAQQRDVQLLRKKQQVRNMVMQLPFVQDVLFEMDESVANTAFRQTSRTAVISLRAREHYSLTHRNFETVRQMVSGAIAGLDPDNIVVIDLDSGSAQPQIVDPDTQHQIKIQRIAFNQQRYFESRIREALADLPGIDVQVQVDLKENCVSADSAQPVMRPTAPPQLPAPGANGMISIELEPSQTGNPPAANLVQQVSDQQSVASTEFEKQIRVLIDVPEALVSRMNEAQGDTASGAPQANQQRAGFELLKTRITARIRSLLPPSDDSVHQIAVNMIAAPKLASSTRPGWDRVITAAQEYWPSAAVLVIGLTLVMVVTRTPSAGPVVGSIQENQDRDVLSIDPAAESAVEDDLATEDRSEARLSRLIEEDPDAAARVIESWIRDAA